VRTTPLPLTEFHHPATFQSRGVAVPFTTPLLAGARVRTGAKSAPELVIPNPSGGRGVYVVQWSGVRALCNPGVHDTMLFRRLTDIERIEPRTLRQAALGIARQGYAGTEAAAAAALTQAADRTRGLRSYFQLLTALLHQIDPASRNGPVSIERTPEFDRRASAILHRIAPGFGCAAMHLATGLDALGDAFAPIGIVADERDARIPRLLAKLDDTRDRISFWLGAAPDNDIGGLGGTVTNAMTATHWLGLELLTAARTDLADPSGLLKRWVAHPLETVASAARCDWVLDGWEGICLLWQRAGDDADRRAALLEMAQVLPVMPREVTEWTDRPVPDALIAPAPRVVSQNDDWRRGAAGFALTQRNEALRAMSE
jgi:hypothetical protein